jgi:NAD-dependent dihydropyrimidine dehydrogenase PreA subunit
MAKRLNVVLSQSQSKNPEKRKLEEEIVAALLDEKGIDVTVVPHLYDIKPDSSGMIALQSISGNMVVLAWLFERPIHWVLDRNNICGHAGEVLLTTNDDDEEEDEESDSEDKDRVVDSRKIPNRKIYALDFRASTKAREFVKEIKRIHAENAVQVVTLGDITGAVTAPTADQRNANPTNDTALAADGNGLDQPSVLNRIEEKGGRRWYPVIDYSRCTNCMECIDFCLFGVYGVDRIDTILVEQPDNCRKGCPACSRVCPENAIMFPQHKTPAIAGSNEAASSLKIDLSQLFGAPTDDKSALKTAADERDEQLALAGRETVGMSVGMPKRQSEKFDQPRDELDALVDELDDLDL